MLTDAQVYCMTSVIYLFRLTAKKSSIGKRRKQSCTPNIFIKFVFVRILLRFFAVSLAFAMLVFT